MALRGRERCAGREQERRQVPVVLVLCLHDPDDLPGGTTRCYGVAEVADVRAGPVEDRRHVVVAGIWSLMAGDDSLGPEARNPVDAVDPRLPLLWAGEREHQVDPVV